MPNDDGVKGVLSSDCSVCFCEPLQVWGVDTAGPVGVFYNCESHQLGLVFDGQVFPKDDDSWIFCGSLFDLWAAPGTKINLAPALEPFSQELCLSDGDCVVCVEEQTATWLLVTLFSASAPAAA